MTDLQAGIEQLRALAESKLVECPDGTIPHGTPTEIAKACSLIHAVVVNGKVHSRGCQCDSTGRIPDPAYAPLLNVVREKCQNPGVWPKEPGKIRDYWAHKSGYITRNWEGMPEGALAGAIYRATRLLHLQASSFGTFDFGRVWWDYMREDIDPDMAAVEEAIKMLAEK